jgi:hypothetical protein
VPTPENLNAKGTQRGIADPKQFLSTDCTDFTDWVKGPCSQIPQMVADGDEKFCPQIAQIFTD